MVSAGMSVRPRVARSPSSAPRRWTSSRRGRARVAGVQANSDVKGTKPITPLLDTINYAAHMKNLSTTQLKQLAQEVRGLP